MNRVVTAHWATRLPTAGRRATLGTGLENKWEKMTEIPATCSRLDRAERKDRWRMLRTELRRSMTGRQARRQTCRLGPVSSPITLARN